MKEYIRKMGLLGLGIAVLTKEKAEEIANDLVKKGEINREEGKVLAKDIVTQAEKQSKELTKRIDDHIKKALKKVDFASKDDIKRLEKKIDALSRKTK